METSPKWLSKALNLFCPDELIEELEGDLVQRYQRDILRHGKSIAKRKLLWNTIRFFRLSIILRNKIKIKRPVMIRNYFKIAIRNIIKQKSYTFLNIAGLSVGLAASLLILQYVKYEKSFDTFHDRPEDIYRIQYNGYHGGVLNFESAVAVPAIIPFLQKNFPEVESVARILPKNGLMSYESPTRGFIGFNEKKMQYAAPDFLAMFNFKLIEGDRKTCLDGVNKLIISQSAAKRFFADEEPIGKRIKYHDDGVSFEVTGIFEDVPENSHVKFDILMSYATLDALTKNESQTHWGWYDFYSYVRVKPGTNIAELQSKIDTALEKERGELWKSRNARQEFFLRPMLDIHLNSHLMYEAEPEARRDATGIYALSAIAFFILAIAWVNYINLATARSFNRANEVGVRKVMGAFRGQLVWQFLTESFLMNLIGCGLALAFVRLGWSSFSVLSGWHIPLSYLYESQFWLLVGSLFVGGTILSGLYPAFVLSSFRPVAVLKGKMMKSSTGNFLRKSLVVFQFSASVILIVGSIIVYQQLRFMKNQDLGLTIEETMVLKGPGITDSLYAEKLDAFKSEMQRIPGVKSITASSAIPGDEIYWTSNIRNLTDNPDDNIIVSGAAVDHDFVTSYNVKILAGRNFDRSLTHRDKRAILNRRLSSALHFKDPADAIGKQVVFGRDTLEVLGVVEDFHQMSLKDPVVPLLMALGYSSNYYSVKIETSNYQSIINAIDEPWHKIFGDSPIEYFFLDQFFNRQYDKDQRFGQVFTLFTVLAIVIASLGLIGLASFMTIQRTREIGIRKVMGSSVGDIVMLLARGFMQPVLIANLIAWPLSWWLMDRWLQAFPYRISISPLFFILASILVAVIAFISVSSQTLKAATLKPVDTLKYE